MLTKYTYPDYTETKKADKYIKHVCKYGYNNSIQFLKNKFRINGLRSEINIKMIASIHNLFAHSHATINDTDENDTRKQQLDRYINGYLLLDKSIYNETLIKKE